MSPGHTISVTVEMTDMDGRSVNGKSAQLMFTANDQPKVMEGSVVNGLVSFDVPAQSRAGLMRFESRVGDVASNIATVDIVAAQPTGIELTIDRARSPHAVTVTSDLITDAFGNAVSDQTLVALDWIDRDGPKASERVQLSNGRLVSDIQCPSDFVQPLRIRAALKNIATVSQNISELCRPSETAS